MIMILAHYPVGDECNDGFFQRVLVIDQIFENEDRVYLDLSLRRHWVPNIINNGKRKIIQAQALIGIPIAIALAVKCKIAYIHSIYKMLWIMYLIPWLTFVIDVHGVVPEEESLVDKKIRARFFGWLEFICFRYCAAAVCVTTKMSNHLRNKYSGIKIKFIILPIMQSVNHIVEERDNSKYDEKKIRVIYSGGMQAWQNVDLMINSIKDNNCEYEFEIYTPQANQFKTRLSRSGVKASVESLNSTKLYTKYRQADYGFILRDFNIVNTVACPTKLIEYMQFGIIPIVLQPEIGDMNHLGFAYILLEDFHAGRLPLKEEVLAMRQKNMLIIKYWENIFQAGSMELKQMVLSKVRARE